uniref:Uncharacterized protein n=1 Tax=Panagrolaimus superbus TaxID=310955 RepID=A0A914YWF1_9BILA
MIPDVKTCLFCFEGDISMINASTMKNICKLKNLQNLESFALANLPEIFNVEDLSKFIKDRVNTKIQFSFNENISDEYKIQLDKLIDIVIKTELINCRLCYPGQNEVKNQILNNRYYRH